MKKTTVGAVVLSNETCFLNIKKVTDLNDVIVSFYKNS